MHMAKPLLRIAILATEPSSLDICTRDHGTKSLIGIWSAALISLASFAVRLTAYPSGVSVMAPFSSHSAGIVLQSEPPQQRWLVIGSTRFVNQS